MPTPLGVSGVFVTPNVRDSTLDAGPRFLSGLLDRYLAGDWGDMKPDDLAANDLALTTGDRIFAAYETTHGRLWIITEAVDDTASRSHTTILRPSDY